MAAANPCPQFIYADFSSCPIHGSGSNSAGNIVTPLNTYKSTNATRSTMLANGVQSGSDHGDRRSPAKGGKIMMGVAGRLRDLLPDVQT